MVMHRCQIGRKPQVETIMTKDIPPVGTINTMNDIAPMDQAGHN